MGRNSARNGSSKPVGLLAWIAVLTACNPADSRGAQPSEGADSDASRAAAEVEPPATAKAAPSGVKTLGEGEITPAKLDLNGIRKRGTIRFLVRGDETNQFLPRSHRPTEDIDMAEAFARRLGLEPILVVVRNYNELIPALLEGRGDVIAASLTVTKERKKKVAFARATVAVKEIVVGRRDMEDPPDGPEDLAGRQLHVRQSSSYADSLSRLEVEGMSIVDVPEHIDTPEIIAAVASGERPLTVADEPILMATLDYIPDAVALFPLSTGREIAWAVRPKSSALRAAVDRFMQERALVGYVDPVFKGDIKGVKKRGVLRVLTRNNPVTYFLHRGRPSGFEYELMKMFADKHDLRLEMVVPPDRESLVPWLLEGKGDVIAASLTVTPARKKKLGFSVPYLYMDEVVVKKKGTGKPSNTKDLAGQKVHVRRSSASWGTLLGLKKQGVGVLPVAAPEDLETESLIGRVASGEIPLTVSDTHILQVEQAYGLEVEAGPTLSEKSDEEEKRGGAKEVAFAVRPSSKGLKNALDAFVKKEYRGLKYNIFKKRYFKDQRRIRTFKKARVDRTGHISPYDDIFKKYSSKYGFDWRLMAAQSLVESGFDPNAKSWVGALGLFQVMPNTGRSLGFTNLTDPERGTHAGIKYMSRLISRFDPEIEFRERVWFALAAYNAGLGHVYDARRLAREQGWEADRWFGNVEKAMLLLSKKEYAKKARHGYVRGGEPVAYVAHIRDAYQEYRQAMELAPASP